MISKPDHPKPEKLYLKAKMATMQVEQVENEESQERSPIENSNDDCKFDPPIHLGIHVKEIYYNNDLEASFTYPVMIDGVDSWIDWLNEITNSKSRIQITTRIEDWDDIPSPSQEDLNKAIAICDESNTIQIDVPTLQEIDSPSWD